MSVSRTVS